MQSVLRLILEHRSISRVPFIWFWPDGARGCAIITHDVEGETGRDFCGPLMDLDESAGLKSAFQIIPEARGYRSRDLVRDVRSRGFEVNLHDFNHDGYLFHDRQKFLERVEQINRYARDFGCRGFRSGAMYRNQRWFDRLEFSYDMSVPNVAVLEPQRGGCCTVMPHFIGGILELPLTTTQDYSLFHILGDRSTALWERQIHLILEKHGLISILTHPDYLVEKRARRVYVELLDHLVRIAAEKNVWMTVPGEVDRWWRERSRMTLAPDGDRWRIEGVGSERATVAYAAVANDQLVFELDRATQ
jgi:hypothetical protein